MGSTSLSILTEQLGCTLHAAHRLDQPTSGVMLLGKNPTSTTMLQEALTSATKEYTAVLRGVMKQSEGTWNHPLTNKGEGFRNPQGRKADPDTCTNLLQNCTLQSILHHGQPDAGDRTPTPDPQTCCPIEAPSRW